MSNYQHTQPGTLIRVALGLAAVGCGVGCAAMMSAGYSQAAFVFGAVGAALALTLILFHSLTVTVSPGEIKVSFGIGLIRTCFRTDTIRSVRAVQNRWYYGWGIRMIPGGWLYNVSGFDAVEIQISERRCYRIGTDEPAALLEAIQSATERPALNA